MSVSKNQLLALSIVCVSPTMHERTDALYVALGPRIHEHVLALDHDTLLTFNHRTNNICTAVIHLTYYQVHFEHGYIAIILNVDVKFRNILCV